MEAALSARKLTLREIAAVDFLNDYIAASEWTIEIDAGLQTVTTNGDPSDNVVWNDTLRSLVWTNLSADESTIFSGALYFNREFTLCHGTVTTGDQQSYLVESLNEEGKLDSTSQALAQAPLMWLGPLSASGEEEQTPILEALDSFADELFVVDAPPAYVASEQEPPTIIAEKDVGESQIAAVDEGLGGLAPGGSMAAAEEAKSELPPMAKIRLVSYSTERRAKSPNDDEDWEPSMTIAFGTDNTDLMHAIVYAGNDDITRFVRPGSEGEEFVKSPEQATDPWPWGFEIKFTGTLEDRTFSGTLVNPKGKEFEWRGKSPTMIEISREGTNTRKKGSDGLSLDPLLLGITSVSRDTETDIDGRQKGIDLAQKEADRIFGRLIFASVDKKVSDMLFPGMFELTPAEKAIQQNRTEFLKRAGMHAILANIKKSDNVKAKTKNKIKLERCNQFIPMCMALQAPVDKINDPVVLYGMDREKDKKILNQLQKEAQEVSRECYLLGYRTAVSSIQEYLKNAGEWYVLLATALTSPIFLLQWSNKATMSEAMGKNLYDLHTKLDVLWHVAHEREDFKAKLPENVLTPEDVMNTLNANALNATLDTLIWDDTSRAHLKEFFNKLDDVQKDERTAKMVENMKKQMIVEGSVWSGWSSLGGWIVDFMKDLQGNKTWSAKEAEAQVALAHAAELRKEALAGGAPAPPTGIQWKSGFFAYVRAAVTVVATTGLLVVYGLNAASMAWDDQVALVGTIAQGLASAGNAMKAIGGAIGTGAIKIGTWLNKFILAPLGNTIKAIGTWLYRKLGDVGQSLIQGIGRFMVKVKDAIKKTGEVIVDKVGKVGTWLKGLPISWGSMFNNLAKIASFGISAVCFWVSIRDCMTAWKHGRVVDKVMSTIGAAIAGLEILSVVIGGIASYLGGTLVAGICAMASTVLAAAGIVFAIVFIVLAFVYQEDPLDDMVEEYGKEYGIV